MKALRQIWVLVMAVIFIIPAAGFAYTSHTCNMSGKTSLVLDQDYNCCPVSEQTGSSADWPLSIEAPECCTNDSKYLKEKDEYTAPESTQHFQVEIVLTLALLFNRTPVDQSLNILSEYTPPPILYSSRDILFQNSSLLL